MENWLRLFSHDQGYGVWDSADNPIDPDDLPISADLRTMARALKTELPTWTIIYYDEAAAARHEDDDEFDGFDADPWEYEIADILPQCCRCTS